MTAEIRIRRAGPPDLEAITALHVRVWRRTYKALAPPEAFAALDEDRRRPDWREALAGGRTTLVADAEGGLAGLVSFGAAGHSAFGGGEVKHLYVDADHAGRGVGRRLLRAALNEMATAGIRRAVLAVVAGNTAAIGFYEKMEGRREGRFTDPGPLWRSENLIYVWDAGADA